MMTSFVTPDDGTTANLTAAPPWIGVVAQILLLQRRQPVVGAQIHVYVGRPDVKATP